MCREFENESPDSIDEQLDRLIDEAKRHEKGSVGQQRPLRIILNSVALRGRLFERVLEAVNEKERSINKQSFIWVMQQSGRKFWIPKWTINWASEEDRADMLGEVWLWFCKKFDTYEPEKASPITWCNRKLRYIASDFYKSLYQSAPPPLPLDQPMGDGDTTFAEELPSPDPDPYSIADNEVLRTKVQACLRKPIFAQIICISDHEEIHCQRVLSKFLLDQMDWKEIFEDLGVAQNTILKSRIRRCYRERCLPRLKHCLDAE